MVAVIARRFGLAHMEIAEDIVGETFLTAAEKWETEGIPPNPAAWLYVVAKQKAIAHFRRAKRHKNKIAELALSQPEMTSDTEPDFSAPGIRDSQLAMIFAVCNPVIQSEAQIGLALRILCGFGIDEIAEAFFSNKETINKRLFRAKEKLRAENVVLELPPAAEIAVRLESVLRVIYLLFNEGYYSRTQNVTLRRDFCYEALRLGTALCEYAPTRLPQTYALVALMCFHASRIDARENHSNALVLYQEQDVSLWDRGLIAQGSHFLSLAATGEQLTTYHLEAGIAYWHCVRDDTQEKWRSILDHYDRLLKLQYSPGAELNRIYAFSQVHGKTQALAQLESLRFPEDRFYYILVAELCENVDKPRARASLEKALELARTEGEKHEIRKKITALQN
ncbi:MAG: RNA polymerase subunit sigma [Spirochaetes bacterium]|nr:RNA polymerase subunit sigma [Spirochaetota bacterium]